MVRIGKTGVQSILNQLLGTNYCCPRSLTPKAISILFESVKSLEKFSNFITRATVNLFLWSNVEDSPSVHTRQLISLQECRFFCRQRKWF
ncbi:hypothetical protein CDAR_205811 [Caerostris darwini]|uniref:Uncharacterized protein n=1 Tax=Caerostris darwini TaxID=1538125 RepID=A0AAV4QWI2_9ARAC|nr:hypothetical protein CDAR_205811 [Caerostris darwini]